MSSALEEMFEHNAWANISLLEFCEKLSDEQLDLRVEGTYGTIRDTLMHVIGGDERYIARLTGEAYPNPLSYEGFPGFEELKDRTRRAGALLKDLAAKKSNDLLNLSLQGGEYSIPASVVLVQAINHGNEHRAQVLVNMTQQGIEPPTLDGWTYGRASGQIRPA